MKFNEVTKGWQSMARIFLKISLLVVVAMMFTLISHAQDKKAMHAPDTLPGVEPEMLSAEYWISLQDDADTVIMTADEIAAFNVNVRNKQVTFTDYYGKDDPLKGNFTSASGNGLIMNLLEPLGLPETVSGGEVRDRLRMNNELLYTPRPLYGSSDFYDNRNAIYDKKMKDDVAVKMNADAVPSTVKRRYGIVVNHALVRQYPTPVPAYSDLNGRLDRFQLTDLCIGNPVAVLHTSLDGDYLFVECPLARGWIAATDIAIADRAAILELVDDTSFLMAANDRVPVYGDPGYKHFVRYFYFSSTLPLVSGGSNGYTVKMPYRKQNGSLGVTTGYVKPGADVHTGYMPYTKSNVLKQIFKLMGTPYGWHGQDNKRDCASTMRVLLRCFGIKVGKYPAFILSASDNQYRMNPNLSAEEKTAETAKLEPVITMVGNSGHIALLLGKARNGKLYYIHQAGWGYRDEDGIQRIVGRVVVNCTEHRFYSINSPNVFTTMRP
ncbi:SH3 domain-containing protein [Candidatus Latescibacterota bacterium]